ncbi:type I-E CRISPR-associated protein Cse1/CasA [Zhihengliuella somnathii]
MTEQKPPPSSFDLREEPWIPCAMLDGSNELLSLRHVFDRSTEIARVVGDNPPQSVAVFRTLLVVFWRAHRLHGDLDSNDPATWWQSMFDASPDEIAAPVGDYLDELDKRFDLFHPATPFMQVADLRKPDDSFQGADRLLPDSESDYFSVRSAHGKEHLSFAEAARALITLHAYDYSGIKAGVAGDPRVKGGKSYPIGPGWVGQTGQVIIHGSNLEETLVLNSPAEFLQRHDLDEDMPAWEQEPQTQISKGWNAQLKDLEPLFPAGPCDVLTWQSRRVRLHADNDRVFGVLVTNGDKIATKNQFADPMTAYRYSRNQSTKTETVHMARELDPELTLWRGLEALLVREGVRKESSGKEPADIQPKNIEWLHEVHPVFGDAARRVAVELVGVEYGPQQSTITNTITSQLPFALDVLAQDTPLLHKELIDTVEKTEAAATSLGQFAGRLAQAAGAFYEFNVGAKEALLHDLAPKFTEWLATIAADSDVESRRTSWEQQVKNEVIARARILTASASPQAHAGRSDGERLVSAATAHGQLLGALKKHLPLAHSVAATTTQKGEAA